QAGLEAGQGLAPERNPRRGRLIKCIRGRPGLAFRTVRRPYSAERKSLTKLLICRCTVDLASGHAGVRNRRSPTTGFIAKLGEGGMARSILPPIPSAATMWR